MTADETEVEVEVQHATGAIFISSVLIALVVGAALAITARIGALDLLIAVAVVQAVVAVAVLFGFRVPGRRGALLLVALAAAGSDIAVSVWPHSRLGTLLAVLGLAVPLLIVYQLLRGAARVRVLESLGGTAIAVVAVTALPALVQLRHEFVNTTTGGHVVFGVVLCAVAALVVGFLADMVIAVPRFDSDVPRGLLAVVASALVGALVGHLTLRDLSEFAGGRGLFAGASLGVLVALFAVGVAFAEPAATADESALGRRIRPAIAVVLPICVLAPVAFLLCLAVRG